MMLLVLACFLVVGAAAASIVTHDSFPSLGLFSADDKPSAPGPLANRDNKADRLSVTALRLRDSTEDMTDAPPIAEPLRQAFASDSPIVTSRAAPNAPVTIPPSVAPPKPKLAAKPAPQKTYTLLSDAQIAGIKDRLKLTPSQESYWPGVEAALRAIARKIHDKKQSNPVAGSPPIDPESAEVSQLKSAAMPLLFQLREDQKREVRALARIIGLEAVASRI
ncbi:MAG: hypothetical protein JWR73_326 [Tardiphaga sp.]|jgi:hypothetical protein|nr:hypothetical protein [Tardiphaga sp.]MDB5624524.1 hypothetical protein [Tardiphaga sp.]